jgi:hypothetical protein
MDISMKCGKLICRNYNENKHSKCDIYDDRRDCSVSMQQRRKNQYHSRRRELE